MSKYAEHSGNNGWSGSELIPLTATEAKGWAEENLDSDVYEEEFGILDEAAPSYIFVLLNSRV